MTHEPTSAQERAEWLRLADGATEGPWILGDELPGHGHFVVSCDGGDGDVTDFIPAEDAAFIAAARTALPRLIADVEEAGRNLANAHAEIERQRADIARLTRERDEWEANEQEQAREVERLTARTVTVESVGAAIADYLRSYTLPANYARVTSGRRGETHADVANRCGPLIAEALADAGMLNVAPDHGSPDQGASFDPTPGLLADAGDFDD